MGVIKVMDQSLANKIAAGEVVERPLSVVKELVENSIDAGSNKIYITLKNSGMDYINVVDDGIGMDKDDAILCFTRHASSKLTSDEMLFKIATLGFRGEALSSIAAVSNIELETCNGEESTAIKISAGIINECKPANFRTGTSITVTKLFYNTPARLKYIKNLYSESSKIIDYVSKCALSNPHIIFKLMNDGKSILETSGSGDYLKTIRDIYSVEVVKQLQELDFKSTDASFKMFIAKPSFQRSNKNYINVFVNKRVVNCHMITKAIIDEFKDYIPRNRYPFCILNIEIEPELIDVNIHPNKYEIKFSKDEEIIDIIRTNVKNFLVGEHHRVEYVKHSEEKCERPQLELERDSVSTVLTNSKMEKYETLSKDLFVNDKIEERYKTVDDKDEVAVSDSDELIVDESINNSTTNDYVPIGQYTGTYILAQNDSELIMIDQHAAVERINYEINQDKLSVTTHTIKDLLVPLVFSRSMNEAMLIKTNLDKITDLDIDISEFGDTDFVVRSIPSWIDAGEEVSIIDTILDQVIEFENVDILELKDNVIESISCKESLKANSRLSVEEMEYIIDELFKCRNPYHCPHGRPIIVSLTLKEIEKMFKRIV